MIHNSSYDLVLHKLIGKSSAPSAGWVRPAEWPDLESLMADNKICGVYKVNKSVTSSDGVIVGFSITTSTGTYTVDWGDGSSNTYASNAVASHVYDPADVDLTDTPYGYKCAVIQIESDTGNITNFNMKSTPSGYSSNLWYGYTWAELDLQIPHVNPGNLNNKFSNMYSCFESIIFRKLGTTPGSAYQCFSGCRSLKNVDFKNSYSAYINNFSGIFSGCHSLQTIPLLDMSSGTDFSGMFNSCYSLQTIPSLDMSSGTNFSYMFDSCYSLQTIPLLDTSSGTDFSGMFSGCNSLQSIPALQKTSNSGDPFAASGTGATMAVKRIAANFWPDANINLAYCINLDVDALEEIFTNLPTVTSRTITITHCRGARSGSGLDRTIATSKGWTVSG